MPTGASGSLSLDTTSSLTLRPFLEVMRQVDALGVDDPFLVPVALDQPFIG
ncbi:MAG: hypothetical protein M3Q50_02000 [Chloroflexota bacterium]|nr:hypothetical protein [Chloroflexota bacterium]